MLFRLQGKPYSQAGQGMTEYIIVVAALVFTFLAPVTPPTVPDWSSDGVGSRSLECPIDPYDPGAGRPAQCTVVEILSEVLRKRNDGYTYAISGTFYPERKVSIDTDIFGDPDDPGSGGGVPGDPGTSAGGEGGDPDLSVGSDTGQTVAVTTSGEKLGSVDENGCVRNDDGEIIGQQQPNGEVWAADIACNVKYTSHSHADSDSHGEAAHGGSGSGSFHNHHEVIGQTGSLQTNNDVLDSSGNKIGTWDT